MALTILVFDGAGTAGRTSRVVDAVVELYLGVRRCELYLGDQPVLTY